MMRVQRVGRIYLYLEKKFGLALKFMVYLRMLAH